MSDFIVEESNIEEIEKTRGIQAFQACFFEEIRTWQFSYSSIEVAHVIPQFIR